MMRPFELNRTVPQAFVVRDITPGNHATRIFCVVADYGWAETIIASGCYHHHANDIARTLGAHLGVAFTLADLVSKTPKAQ